MIETLMTLAGFAVVAAFSTGLALADEAGADELRRSPAQPAGVRAVVTEVEVGGAFRSILAIPLTGTLYVKRGRRFEVAGPTDTGLLYRKNGRRYEVA